MMAALLYAAVVAVWTWAGYQAGYRAGQRALANVAMCPICERELDYVEYRFEDR